MSTTEASGAVVLETSEADPVAAVAPTERPSFREMLDDVLPVIGVVFVAGPPAIFLAGPWLLLALMLSGPFALLVAFVIVGIVAAALVVALAAIVAAPYLLVRHLLLRYRASQGISVAGTQIAALPAPRIAA